MMNWKLEKFIGNNAIYARCGNCGWEYCCSSFDVEKGTSIISKIYPYCPMCGEKAENAGQEKYEVIWNEREW